MRATRKTQLWTVAIAVVAMVFVTTVTTRQFRHLHRIETELGEIQRAVESRDRHELELARLNENIARLEALVLQGGRSIPRNADLGDFVRDLSRMADRCGVVPGEIRPGEPRAEERVKALPVTFRIQGTGKAVFDLIQNIERMTRLTRFEHLAARTSSKRDGDVEAEVRVSVFYREL